MLCKHGGDKAGIHAGGKHRYCPSWSALNKAGCPPKNKQMRSMLEVAKGKRTKMTRPLMRCCQLCLKFSHRTINCWVQEKNKEYRPKNWKWKDTHVEDLATIDKRIVEDTSTTKELPLGQGNGEEGIAD